MPRGVYTRHRPAPVLNGDGTMLIPLLAQNGSVRAYALIDAADADLVTQWRWCLNARGYAARTQRVGVRALGRQVGILLHREVLGLGVGDAREGDHRNGDRLDNRRSNLLIVTKAQQAQNTKARGGTSRYRGVSWNVARGEWSAYVQADGKQHRLGYFSDEIEAAEAARQGRLRLLPYSVERAQREA